MSGHSKWATIRRKKGANDAKRGKIFTQLIRELVMAAKLGGPDPHSNPRLRLAMDKARAQNMPKDNVQRAIKRGSGGGDTESYEEIRYEGYGPAGVAVLVGALTDNRNRTVSELRHIFNKHGGNLGSSGCVAHLFEKKGVLSYERADIDAERLMEVAIEADALDVIDEGDTIEVQTSPDKFERVKAALDGAGFVPASAEVSMVPITRVAVEGKTAETLLNMLELLDEHDDINEVSANFELPDEETGRAESAS
jgi:YebC/PmpR family DNA-binding regulatory protein